jgi:hypothetical protein
MDGWVGKSESLQLAVSVFPPCSISALAFTTSLQTATKFILLYFGLLSVGPGFNYWIPVSRLLRGEEHISSFHYNSETAALVAC